MAAFGQTGIFYLLMDLMDGRRSPQRTTEGSRGLFCFSGQKSLELRSKVDREIKNEKSNEKNFRRRISSCLSFLSDRQCVCWGKHIRTFYKNQSGLDKIYILQLQIYTLKLRLNRGKSGNINPSANFTEGF